MVKILNTIMKDAVWAVIAIMGGVCSFAGDVQAPSSLAVAEAQCSIVYQNGQEKDSLHFSDGLSYEGAESKITRYEPKGTSALITAVYVDKTKEAPIGGEYYEKDPSQGVTFYPEKRPTKKPAERIRLRQRSSLRIKADVVTTRGCLKDILHATRTRLPKSWLKSPSCWMKSSWTPNLLKYVRNSKERLPAGRPPYSGMIL